MRPFRVLALRQAGWTYAAIGQALGVSSTRSLQLVRRAELIRSSEKGALPQGVAGSQTAAL
jgi:hypothetical protein